MLSLYIAMYIPVYSFVQLNTTAQIVEMRMLGIPTQHLGCDGETKTKSRKPFTQMNAHFL